MYPKEAKVHLDLNLDPGSVVVVKIMVWVVIVRVGVMDSHADQVQRFSFSS